MEQWKLAAVIGAVALGGVVSGGWLFGSRGAAAQEEPREAEFTRCFVARQPTVDTDDEGRTAPLTRDHLVLVPDGYTAVGGGGGPAGDGTVVFCR